MLVSHFEWLSIVPIYALANHFGCRFSGGIVDVLDGFDYANAVNKHLSLSESSVAVRVHALNQTHVHERLERVVVESVLPYSHLIVERELNVRHGWLTLQERLAG